MENSKTSSSFGLLLRDSYDGSLSDSSGSDKASSSSNASNSVHRRKYWLKMRGIGAGEAHNSQSGTLSKKKRSGEDEDYEAFPMKKSQQLGMKPRPGVLAGRGQKAPPCVRKEPPSYAAGSPEERWYLEILHLGRVICPKCRCVGRKTVEGLKKHMSNCRQEPYTCQHCGKQLRSLAGMKYHVMADHSHMPVLGPGEDFSSPSIRQKLRKMLKRIGRLKCPLEGCPGSFTSVMGYLYHAKKCGKQESELEGMSLKCHHCGKAYKSRAGLVYHLKSEHGAVTYVPRSGKQEAQREEGPDLGRVQRRSAKVATFYLHEIASEELVKEWPKRKVLQDLVPDDRKLKYSRPGLPSFSQEVLRKWRTEVKTYTRIRCPNPGCASVYCSISGLKTHLGSCTQGDFVAGKYRCLLCEKEFISESGVKYHINSMHGEDWFVEAVDSTESGAVLELWEPSEGESQRWGLSGGVTSYPPGNPAIRETHLPPLSRGDAGEDTPAAILDILQHDCCLFACFIQLSVSRV
ncbi:zinc finger protein 512 [Ascaphus truei]|uniref:zinc finger protein 512 n=1 Tax=Ascaphus truei TaxID=8439 RepID=UPI003F59C16D